MMLCHWCAAPLDSGFDLFTGTLPSQLPHGGRPRRPGELLFVCLDRCAPPRRIVTRLTEWGLPGVAVSTIEAPLLVGAGHG